MFEITREGNGTIRLAGRFDAAQIQAAEVVFAAVEESCDVDFAELEYISSAGLGLLFATQRRLLDEGKALRLLHLNPHIREIFQIAGFHNVFEIE